MAAAWVICILGVSYAVNLAFGLLSLNSPEDPIGVRFFSMLEWLIIIMAPFMVACMAAVNACAPPKPKPAA